MPAFDVATAVNQRLEAISVKHAFSGESEAWSRHWRLKLFSWIMPFYLKPNPAEALESNIAGWLKPTANHSLWSYRYCR